MKEIITIRHPRTGELTEVERFVTAQESGLTEAGASYILGYMANAAPDLAARALISLKELEADYRGPGPGYWFAGK